MALSKLSKEIKIIRGDDIDLTISFTDTEDTAINITGYTIWFTLRKYQTSQFAKDDTDDSDKILQKKITQHQDATGGISVIKLTNTDTNNLDSKKYDVDIQLKDSNNKITTILGTAQVFPDVTRSTT